MTQKKTRDPKKMSSYFQYEIPILAVVTVSGLIYNVGMAAGPYFQGQLVQGLYDLLKRKIPSSRLVQLALLYIVVIALVQVCRAVKRFSVRIFANHTSRRMRRLLYNALLHRHFGDDSGSLMTKAISDVDSCVEGMRKFTTEVFDTGVVMIAYLAMLLYYDVRLTFLACMFTPMAYLIANILKKQVVKANRAYKESESTLNTMTLDRIVHAMTYRVTGREQAVNGRYEKQLTDYEHKSAISNIFEGALTPLYDAIAMFGIVLIIYFGGRNVLHIGWKAWNLASFTTFLACFTNLATKVSHAAKLFNAVQKAQVSWVRIKPLMSDPVYDHYQKENPVINELAFDQVTAYYHGHPETAVKDINLTAASGQIIGITGEVACGKSLLGKALIREADYQGNILINGTELKELSPHAAHQWITYMGHDPMLLSDSIKNNICLGDDLDVGSYLKMVCLDEEVASLQDGPDTLIGNGGMTLSGGQQQRVALARTLAHAKPIIVLDDPFSAVDQATEQKILDQLKSLKGHIILLMTHRVDCFSQLDQIVFINDHRVFTGNHADLLSQNKDYQKLIEGGKHHA
ncbi:ABC transporter ATP-binding protein [Lactobacillus nasalidis]|uniref:ABC transporter ATP-binding protein n=1 Tax=Lactobacillus nasalidis TaxID=2797258 RepID=A0ABQ3W8U4_9LACO|nr:ABC transporter ATP-binding protein [Lactobacillus nasalidis]GHV96968.1 ABC transporter ATP-binding protein [Lactobacillus nasalidis]GHV98575.1 ABC transporter ATP-binding protein [Lactobacillus nasalidis]GHW02082.1 ABC transporter ATP-binding protein [Lactobacillus nasalidis]